MIIRRAAAVALAASVLFGASACTTAEPDPTPTPPFASEAEAFAAAEATYRAYVDALNGVDLSDPETFEPVFALTTGELNAVDRQTLSEMHADGLIVSGGTVLVSVGGLYTQNDMVALAVCQDINSIDVVDSEGQSVVSEERPPTQSLEVLVHRGQSQDLLVASITTRDDDQCV